MEFVNADCLDQIHKLAEDFTLTLGNLTLIASQKTEPGAGEAG